MKREVLLTIKGFQKYETHEDNDLETKACGEYYFRNGWHYVLYEEQAEGFQQSTKSVLKMKNGCVEMTRKGLVNTTMVFDRDKETVSHYKTPFGEVLLGIRTKALRLQETDETIKAEVQYSLQADGIHMADCRILIEVCAAG